MRFYSLVLSFLAATSVFALPPTAPPTPDTYVWVQYAANDTQPGFQTFFEYKECYPYTVDGHKAAAAVFLQGSTCYQYSNAECTGSITPPVGVPVTGGVTLINLFDFVHLVGGGAICYKNSLPNLPLLPEIEADTGL
ncbi:hypothetical protein M422DRAFT_49189 [Sphaerobolus stellatus SS14]|uniref:Uncharacterized protein n=1 Tax=Sphaerobolus stellatus (strain SS14) TaxID=990650 RepID=A0A0C9VFL3_SPHS4|nr:hypothetical protein M422DRAFT_49189 [Sphaerobolus stellatus SS14]